MAVHLDVLSELGPKLGPVILQFPYYRKARGVTLEAFLERLDAEPATRTPSPRRDAP